MATLLAGEHDGGAPSPRSFSRVRSAAGSTSTPRFLISSGRCRARASAWRSCARRRAAPRARGTRARTGASKAASDGQVGDASGEHPRPVARATSPIRRARMTAPSGS